MTIVHKENPELFDLYYGDYIGIISNYLSPINSIELILKGSRKYIEIHKTKEAYDILCYCNKFFEENLNHDSIFYFITQHILVDYNNNNKKLVSCVIKLLNLLKNNGNTDRINFLLNENLDIILCYTNKKYIL